MSNANSTNNFGVVAFIVDPTPGLGTNTTISSALSAASSGQDIFIRPGTYTENLTLKAGVNLIAMGGDNLTLTTKIIGKVTMTVAGTCSLNNIEIQTNSDYAVEVTGSAASILYVNNCFINCLNHTGLHVTSSGGAVVSFNNSSMDIGTTGITAYSITSNAIVVFNYCVITNNGNSTVASDISAGNVTFNYSTIVLSLTTSSTGLVFIRYTLVVLNGLNLTALTTSGTGQSNHIWYSILLCWTASALSIGDGTKCQVLNSDIDSVNTNAITGLGSISYSGISFSNSSSLINTTTQSPKGFNGGGYVGYNDNTSPPAGYLGQQIRSYRASGDAVSISNGAQINIASIDITPGCWDVTAFAEFQGITVGTQIACNITATSSTIAGNAADNVAISNGSLVGTLVVPQYRVNLSSTTTYYMVGYANYSGGSCKAYGRISAVRVA